MEKVVLATYRTLHKRCRRIDAGVALRTQLMCTPQQIYDHHHLEWRPYPPREMEGGEPQAFLDALIRRLNNGKPQYIPPLPEELAQTVAAYKELCVSLSVAAVQDTPLAAQTTENTAGTGTRAKNAGAKASAATSLDSIPGTGSSATVPLSILPYSRLTVALRQLYEATPFSMSNVSQSFSAVKELQCLCRLDETGKAKLVTLESPSAAPILKGAPDIPQLQRALEVALHCNSAFHEICADQGASTRQKSRRTLHSSPVREAHPSVPTEDAVDAAAPEARPPTADGAPCSAIAGAAETTEQGQVAADARSTPHTPSSEAGSDACAEAPVASAEPPQVQLLLAHPTTPGFFRHAVLLVVQHEADQSCAFMVNKPLRDADGEPLPLKEMLRLGKVHPIFRRHLAEHPFMIGGPVFSGNSFDDTIFLLHQVPGVPDACPLGSHLWLSGNLDVLLEKLDRKEASAQDIMVLCGSAGWGVDQLNGEVRNGCWVVASGPSTDASIGRFVVSLARLASHPQDLQRRRASAVPPPIAEETNAQPTAEGMPHDDPQLAEKSSLDSADGSADSSEAQQMMSESTRRVDWQRHSRRRRAESGNMQSGPRETLPWVRAYASLGQPYAEMAMNQYVPPQVDEERE